jgi:hypothetical protein
MKFEFLDILKTIFVMRYSYFEGYLATFAKVL